MIGREKEKLDLNAIYNSKKSELVVLYGRKGLGKTFLIEEAFKDKITFRHAALSPSFGYRPLLKEQLYCFYRSLLMHGLNNC